MNGPLPDELDAQQKRDDLNRQYKARGGVLGFALSPFIIGAIFFPYYYQGKQCPPLTFNHWVFSSATNEFLLGFFGWVLALMVLGSFLVAQRINRKSYRIVIGLSLLGFLAGAVAYADSINYYYCTTPTNIVTRSGILNAPQSLSWDDVTDVHGWCWISTGRGQAGSHGGSLRLTLNNSEDLRFGLVDGNQILLEKYKAIREALKNNRTYHYHMDGTVNPDMCPAPLYPLLKSWDAGH